MTGLHGYLDAILRICELMIPVTKSVVNKKGGQPPPLFVLAEFEDKNRQKLCYVALNICCFFIDSVSNPLTT